MTSCLTLLSLVACVALATSMPVVPGALEVTSTCDDEMELYADGVLQASSTDVSEITRHSLATCPTVVAIYCRDRGIVGGIYASLAGQGVSHVSDASWLCRSYDDTSAPADWSGVGFDDSGWAPAVTLSDRFWSRVSLPDLDPRPSWIWSSAIPGRDRKVYCRKTIPGCGDSVTEGTTSRSTPQSASSTPTESPTTRPPTTTTTTRPSTTTSSTTTPQPATTTRQSTTSTIAPSPTTRSRTVSTVTPTRSSPSPASGLNNCDTRNPCVPLTDPAYQTWHPHETAGRFIMCGPWGSCTAMNCPAGLVWNAAYNTCDWPAPVTTTISATAGYSCAHNSPCRDLVPGVSKYHYPHVDPATFIQCGLDGRCYELPCPPGTTWDSSINTCNWP